MFQLKARKDGQGSKTSTNQPAAAKRKTSGKSKPAVNFGSEVSYEVEQIDIDRIEVERGRRPINSTKLKEIVESIRKDDLQHPVHVRTVGFGRIFLVAGLHRLKAMEALGHKTIAARVDDDPVAARRWQHVENLARVELTPTEEAAAIAALVELAEEDEPSGQDAPKKGRGRPKSGTSDAARKVPVKGKTEGARRKRMERLKKISDLPERVKQAGKKAQLNQSKFQLVAAEKTPAAQLAKVEELATLKSQTRKGSGALKPTFDTLQADWEKRGGGLKRPAWEKTTTKDQDRFVTEVLGKRKHKGENTNDWD